MFKIFNMEEIWKRVPGYEDYEISSIGRLISYRCKKPKLIKGCVTKKGYLIYDLKNKNNRFICGSHVAVAMAFLGHKPCGMELVIDHINDNKMDNRVENLQIVSQRYNTHKTQGKYSSKYKGVYWSKHCKKWHARIKYKSKVKHLGLFIDEYEAYLAYEKALKELI